jgi:2-hydroxychromene-2-carboxylate isomerase
MSIDILIDDGHLLSWTTANRRHLLVIDFVFDYRSPYSYLGDTQLKRLGADVRYVPIDILAVMTEVNNQPSPKCPPKAAYAALDAGRWAARYGVALRKNQAFFGSFARKETDPALLSRAAIAAQRLGIFDKVHTGLFEAVWGGGADLSTAEARDKFLESLGVADVRLWERADEPDIRQALEANSHAAAKRGVFGVPTFFVGDEMFFGNDRVEFVADALKKRAVA